ncbi:MAG: hypothetical protein KJZ96_09405 [Rhodocyclaceae bacterium]|jgi:hypothetical protein|nr:hypothetical protein [Rhodocyclaceae bacterium]MCL4758553.1 hypothetical protein [Rhodocyclaceae bacterium]
MERIVVRSVTGAPCCSVSPADQRTMEKTMHVFMHTTVLVGIALLAAYTAVA